MLDTQIRKWIDPFLGWLIIPLLKTRLEANHITIGGFIIGLLVIPLLAFEFYLAALVVIVINRLLDGIDGVFARKIGATEFGGYLDIVLDFFWYSAVVFGFALAQSSNALAASWLIFSFVGTGTSFLAYAVIVEKLGISHAQEQNKALHYLAGITEGTETIALFFFLCLFPQWFSVAAWIFGLLCWITAINRVCIAKRDFGTR